MNRLQNPTFAWQEYKTPTDLCAAGKIFAAQEDSPHAHFAPLHYERNYAYPLLVWLHGSGDSEKQLRRIMPLVSMRNYVATAPRATHEMLKAGSPGYQWLQSSDHFTQADERVRHAIASAQDRFNIRPDRIFLAGYGSGGTMAFRIAASDPGRYAGVLSLCGPFPTEGAPLAQLDVVRRLPLFVAACRQGTYYPTTQVCNDLRLFHSAGMSITLKEYPGEDRLSEKMLSDVDRWIMEQIAGTPATVNSSSSAELT